MPQTPSYPPNDLRRLLVVVGTIGKSPTGATLVNISRATGLDKHVVTRMIEKATTQLAMKIIQDGALYRIEDWGPVIKKQGALQALTGALGAP